MLAQNIAFGVIAVLATFGAIRVVTTKNVVHAALWLVLVLAAVGASFLLLGAEFVGITQVLVYIGAIVVLFLFGIMLTRAQIGRDPLLTSRGWPMALFVAVALLGVLSFSLIDAFHGDKLPDDTRVLFATPEVTSVLTELGLPTDQPGLTKDDLEARAADLQQGDDEKAALLDRIERIEPSDLQSTGSNTAAVSDTIFTQYLVPFEVVSMLLLAALVGAIVLARKE
jgi:NADH-quinone oxidoreductase subunit J